MLQEKTAKRKVGRPIAYQGNPFSPDVTPEQRRVILRRVANRESARRVRERRHEELERTTQKVSIHGSEESGHADGALKESSRHIVTTAARYECTIAFCFLHAFSFLADILQVVAPQADYLERSNDILCRKLKKAQAHETQLQGYLTQLNRDILAKDHENAGLRTTIAHMRECEVRFFDAPLHCPGTVLHHDRYWMHDRTAFSLST